MSHNQNNWNKTQVNWLLKLRTYGCQIAFVCLSSQHFLIYK